MGTNYYRVPTDLQMQQRKLRLRTQSKNMDIAPGCICNGFPLTKEHPDSWESHTPWTEFLNDANVHLGKRSGGWKFCWNFHKNRLYSNKAELLAFIRSGRVVDEYGTEMDPEEFITMALEWGQPDGWVLNAEYEKEEMKNGHRTWGPNYYDLIIDGLRVSTSTEFS